MSRSETTDVTPGRLWHDLARRIGGRNLSLKWVLALYLSTPLLALNPILSFDQYLHASWTQDQGIPLPEVHALAQTVSGYLWLGTPKGLLRFDGMRFVRWSPAAGPGLPNPDILSLLPASDGALWVGTRTGLSRVARGRVTNYDLTGLPCKLMFPKWEDRTGSLWIFNECPASANVALLSPDGKLRTFGSGDGLPGGRIRSFYRDRFDRLWVGTDRALCQWSPGQPAQCTQGPAFYVSSIADDLKGQIFFEDDIHQQVFRFSDGVATPMGPPLKDSSIMRGAFLCDRDGNLWVGTSGKGLLRYRGDQVDRFGPGPALSGNMVNAILEDHEGDIWVGTARGLDKIRDPQIQRFSTLNGLSNDLANAVYASLDGAIWVGTPGGLDRFFGEAITSHAGAGGLPDPMVLSLYNDAQDRLWVGTIKGLAVQSGTRFREVLAPDGQYLTRVLNIGGDQSGTIWVLDARQGLFAVRSGVVHAAPLPDPPLQSVYGMYVTRSGDIWLGDYRGGAVVLHEGAAKRYGAGDGLAKGPVRAFYEDAEGAIWVGSGEGLSRFQNSRWTAWTTAQGLPEGGVQSIVEDDIGGIWLLTPTGMLRLPRSSLGAEAKLIVYHLYGPVEGLRVASSGGMSNPRLARSRDGRLWICTEDGVAAIDPARLKANPIAPPVAIEQVLANGKALDPFSTVETGVRARDLQITYTGISLTDPERVRFRYRLFGWDGGWTDAGSRRTVTYVNLPPRHYRFQVQAANNDGLWNDAGAQIALRVDPYFYQTLWFYALCVTTLLALAWCIHRLRVRRVVMRYQLIAAERTRFSRELHDSLLQGFSGVVYLLEAASRQFEAAPAASKQRLEKALDQADQSLREARQMIASMRIPALENSTLPDALKSTLAPIVGDLPLDYQFEVKGHVRQGPYDVEANCFLIAREAVTNAVNHAEASRIRLELLYTPKELRLTVQDNGVGFTTEAALAKAGHWGFRGMRERARQIGATFTSDSAPGKGCTILVIAPWKK